MQRLCYYLTHRNCVRKKTKTHIASRYHILNACRMRRFGGRKSFNFQLNIKLAYCWYVCIVCAHAGLIRKGTAEPTMSPGCRSSFLSSSRRKRVLHRRLLPLLLRLLLQCLFFFFLSRCLLGKQCAGNGLYRPHSCFFVTITQRAGCDISTSSAYAMHSRTALENVVL